MPTHEETQRFLRDWKRLSRKQREQFDRALEQFIADLPTHTFRPGLRVKGYKGSETTFEMTFAPNGRALWEYGDEVIPGEPHVIWLRIGTHEIFV